MEYKPMLLLAAQLLGVAGATSAHDFGDRVGHRLDRGGDRIEQRLDHKGERIEARYDQRANRPTSMGTSAWPIVLKHLAAASMLTWTGRDSA